MAKLGNILAAFVDFIYPLRCMHCATPVCHGKGGLCFKCALQLTLINMEERCPCCFSAEYEPEHPICYLCFMQPPVLKKYAAAFDDQDVAASLINKLKYANQPYLAQGAAAYMVLQLLNLKWPLPDLIVPVPLTFTQRISQGYNTSLLLAESLGEIVKRPVQSLLYKSLWNEDYEGKAKQRGNYLNTNSFLLKKEINVQDKVILLVKDKVRTGHTLNCCAEVLYEGFPKAIYGLSFCKSI
jgi:predicted amidophosphoribosyltransferase